MEEMYFINLKQATRFMYCSGDIVDGRMRNDMQLQSYKNDYLTMQFVPSRYES